MILFIILLLALVILTVITVFAISIGGSVAIILFGDVIVCMIFMGLLLKKIIKR